MSNSLRYRNPEICDYLAGQYVAGTMTPRVRTRMDTLIPRVSELENAVAFWADSMANIDYEMPEAKLSDQHWANIDARILSNTSNRSTDTKTKSESWWEKLAFWQLTSAVSMATSLVLFFVVALSPAPSSNLIGPSYMAAMSASTDENQTIQFVVNAYPKSETSPSRLVVQWPEREPRRFEQALHIWAEDRDTGKLTYIGVEPDADTPWHLQKSQWQAVENSRRLLATANNSKPTEETTLFSGLCLQLQEWTSNS